ncbi:hypothetical protein MHY85_07620 [Cellulomonas sp. ACRRI]|uniref:hypothetical protein n=1 Tax=Cellulomonas sp. ACRRI TaxID=2918188 RepID=UPI001EF2EC73|nr:hypothetical protein [Cellulomonas sp. ACRRI]MCG7285841.1 hypothetical protein [Cellulomonas sp. ACRRI]
MPVPRRRPAAALLGAPLLAAAAALTAGCGPAGSPAAPAPSASEHLGGQPTPDVTGEVAGGTLVRASEPSYEGMPLAGRSGQPSVLGADGSQATVDDLRDGDRVEVWLVPGGVCAASSPVQCDVLTVRVTEAAAVPTPAASPTPAPTHHGR